MDGIIPLTSALFSKSSNFSRVSSTKNSTWRYSLGLKGDPDYVITNADGTTGQNLSDGGDAYIHFDIYGEGLYIIWTGTLLSKAGLSGLTTSPTSSGIGGGYTYILYVTSNYDVYSLPAHNTYNYCGNATFVTSSIYNFGYVSSNAGCSVYVVD